MAKKKGPKLPKKIKWEQDADIHQRKFVQVYEAQCSKDSSRTCPWLMTIMKKAIEERFYVRKFIIEAEDDISEGTSPITLDPVVNAIRKSHFIYVHEVAVWNMELQHQTVANLALLLEKGTYPIVGIELMDCSLLYYSVERLARSFRFTGLSEVNLDYNEFGDEGCGRLCAGCKNNKTIVSLSLCYCDLTSSSGGPLGEVAFGSTIREFYLDGNKLGCQGVVDMMRSVAVAAEDDNRRRIEEERMKAMMMVEGALQVTDKIMTSQMGTEASGASGGENEGGEKPKKKKKKKGKKAKKSADPPTVGPFVYNLHLVDNGIDAFGPGGNEMLFPCVGVISRLIMYSHHLCELDLDDNPIGNLAAQEILAALERRKEGNLPGLKMITTAEIQKDTFSAITKLASGLKKKKKKGKKKKKKK